MKIPKTLPRKQTLVLQKIPPKKKVVAAHTVSSRQIELLDLVYCLGGFKRDGSRLKRV